MKSTILVLLLLAVNLQANAYHFLTPFEISGGKQTATYAECIQFYYRLQSATGLIRVDSSGVTDAGYPLHTIVYPARKGYDFKGITIFINNGIHPGEPDGVDASMMLLRDIAEGSLKIPANVRLVVIPLYNIGGALNRNNSTRVNQDGPESYGFRGNSQNLDLNRDFVKCDSREAHIFRQMFHLYQPEIFIDNHVSDGADYQHTMTLLSTQYDKLGGSLGRYFREKLDPMLYKKMEDAGYPISPYVNAEESTPDHGWTAFYDPPRFSSGYAALFNTIAWVPETHMLKPFDQRVKATYALMKAIISLAGSEANNILVRRKKDQESMILQKNFPLSWKDSAATLWPFKGYEAAYKTSEVTGQQRLYYDHSKPLNISVPIRDHYTPFHWVKAPNAYIIPQGWRDVIERILDNRRIDYDILQKDTVIYVTAYTIDSFKTLPAPYESHYKHSAIHASPHPVMLQFHQGDYVFPTDQFARRYLIEALEPESEDGYFAWNFFDAILQRKEGYSDYRWEDIAVQELRDHPEIKRSLEAKKQTDTVFAKDASAQLFYVYRHSRWYENEHMRYPVYRIE